MTYQLNTQLFVSRRQRAKRHTVKRRGRKGGIERMKEIKHRAFAVWCKDNKLELFNDPSLFICFYLTSARHHISLYLVKWYDLLRPNRIKRFFHLIDIIFKRNFLFFFHYERFLYTEICTMVLKLFYCNNFIQNYICMNIILQNWA